MPFLTSHFFKKTNELRVEIARKSALMLLYLFLPWSFLEYVQSKLFERLPIRENFHTRSRIASFREMMSDDREFDKWRTFPEQERRKCREKAREMFYHGYRNYMEHAFPLDELDPIGCKGRGPDVEKPDNININDVLGQRDSHYNQGAELKRKVLTKSCIFLDKFSKILMIGNKIRNFCGKYEIRKKIG